MTDLSGRRALVTGASSGIGLATALALADAGAEVHGAARRLEAMRQVAHGRFTSHMADATSAEQMAALVAEVSAAGPIDVAVFSAGTNIPDRRLQQLTPGSWDTLVAANLSSAFYGMHAALPAMRRPQPPDAEIRRRMLRAEDVAAACIFLAGLPDTVHVPELTILPAGLQALGRTS